MNQWNDLRWRYGLTVDALKLAVEETNTTRLRDNLTSYWQTAEGNEGTPRHGYSLAVYLMILESLERRRTCSTTRT